MEPEHLASQLRCPSGDKALEVGISMNKANYNLNRECINLLELNDDNRVLEIGPGNGAFVQEILQEAKGINYVGIDISTALVAEASRLNDYQVRKGVAKFECGDSADLPFEAGYFDKVFTVHTLYFWDKPYEHLSEIRRVLKPSGTFCIAFGNREFMKNLPFVKYGFELYDDSSACNLLREVGFNIESVHEFTEHGLSNTGESVDKLVHVIVCKA
ncbi:class I SAM-dependent methyltransferase [Moritella viscosa]|uniref:SAM-dependent methyltransferase n=1 Tax=Moritella viscosa TaxID=80854 RepID=A0A090IJX5_9GAMM|nr:class I SAM-dependent methyltransferase [Moritella viscosa]CED60524.1 SAM-dependent methyltransferase [Moritella viscosa]SGY97246.1 SAM-dependent methyltransferase [Moritella viscosa]SGZ10303.1 SAM-dependent methyltransferase [Moritella viscosa]SGZ10404.1 SAM-dependent methyltransferase [Moritella viscosa]SHO11788.1 SAM-dependent methyltransferase [Moritella viscosa]